jgi:hypothetical protein
VEPPRRAGRHLGPGDVSCLDGAVQQANADFAPEEKADAGDEPSEADAAMTEAFRSFAQAPSD